MNSRFILLHSSKTFDSKLSFQARQLSLWSCESNEGLATEQWTVRESPRARRLSVRVFHTGRVEVIVPRRTAHRTVERFLKQHRDWIERKRAETRRHVMPPQPFPPQQIELASCSEVWRIHLTGGTRRPSVKILASGLLGISGNASDARSTRHALRRWLITKASETLGPLLDAAARELNLKYSKAVIRRQRTRWGSCSTRGTISLNCCLLFQRPAVVRYLLIHELAHTLHMNHSDRFWEYVARHCPDYKRLDRELLDGWRRVPTWVLDL